MGKCTKCKQDIEKNARYCEHCGLDQSIVVDDTEKKSTTDVENNKQEASPEKKDSKEKNSKNNEKSENKRRINKKVILAVAVFLIMVGGGVGYYFYTSQKLAEEISQLVSTFFDEENKLVEAIVAADIEQSEDDLSRLGFSRDKEDLDDKIHMAKQMYNVRKGIVTLIDEDNRLIENLETDTFITLRDSLNEINEFSPAYYDEYSNEITDIENYFDAVTALDKAIEVLIVDDQVIKTADLSDYQILEDYLIDILNDDLKIEYSKQLTFIKSSIVDREAKRLVEQAEAIEKEINTFKSQDFYGSGEDPEFNWNDALELIRTHYSVKKSENILGDKKIQISEDAKRYYYFWDGDTHDNAVSVVYEDGTIGKAEQQTVLNLYSDEEIYNRVLSLYFKNKPINDDFEKTKYESYYVNINAGELFYIQPGAGMASKQANYTIVGNGDVAFTRPSDGIVESELSGNIFRDVTQNEADNIPQFTIESFYGNWTTDNLLLHITEEIFVDALQESGNIWYTEILAKEFNSSTNMLDLNVLTPASELNGPYEDEYSNVELTIKKENGVNYIQHNGFEYKQDFEIEAF